MSVCVNTDLHLASHIFLVDINEICVSPNRVWPYIILGSSCGNDNVHSLVDIIVPPFCIPTVSGLLAIVCLWWSLCLIYLPLAPVSTIPFLGYKVIIVVYPTELT